MKACKDCKHMAIPPEERYLEPVCRRSAQTVTDYFQGTSMSVYYSCQVERQYATLTGCGPDARFFEPPEAKDKIDGLCEEKSASRSLLQIQMEGPPP